MSIKNWWLEIIVAAGSLILAWYLVVKGSELLTNDWVGICIFCVGVLVFLFLISMPLSALVTHLTRNKKGTRIRMFFLVLKGIYYRREAGEAREITEAVFGDDVLHKLRESERGYGAN